MPQSFILIALSYLSGYVLLDWLSYVQPFAAFGITPWNPATGLTVALILIHGTRFIAILPLAPILGDAVVRGLPLPVWLEIVVACVIAGGYAAVYLALVHPRAGFDIALGRARDLVLLVGATAYAALIVAAGYIGALYAAGIVRSDRVASAAAQLWVGDMIGILIVTPFILVLATRSRLPKPSIEMLLPLALLGLSFWMVFGLPAAYRLQLFYLLFLPVIWAGLRFGVEGVTWALLTTQICLILAIQLGGYKSFDLITYQALMIVLSISGLAVGVLVGEQRRTEQQLRMHQEALARTTRLRSMGELAAALAHEINQPLTAIGNYSRVIDRAARSATLEGDTIREAAAKSVEQVERAAEVLRRLRELIRVGRIEVKTHPVKRVMEEAVTLCQADFDVSGVQLEIRASPVLPDVAVDRLQIEQVIINLLRNALEAITEAGRTDGRVVLSAGAGPAGMVTISVRDNGPGFEQSIREGGIGTFATTKAEGTGLGLAICRSIVEAHGGRLTIGAEPAGTSVSFTIQEAGA
jgi:two-component system sensor kinase FixL